MKIDDYGDLPDTGERRTLPDPGEGPPGHAERVEAMERFREFVELMEGMTHHLISLGYDPVDSRAFVMKAVLQDRQEG